jgi:hypothetical protein
LAAAVALTTIEPVVTFITPDGAVVPPTEPLMETFRLQTVAGAEALAKKAVKVWLELAACWGTIMELVVLVEVTLKAEVTFALSNCQ